MGFYKNNNFSGLTAAIMFADIVVGGLQDVSTNEGFNNKPLYSLGRKTPINIPGFTSSDISAKRAYIEKDTLESTIINCLNPTMSSDEIGKFIIPGNRIADNLFKMSLNKPTQTIINSFLNMDKLFFSIYFDIKIFNQKNSVAMVANNCILDTRKSNYSVGNIIIMQDITFKCSYISHQ